MDRSRWLMIGLAMAVGGLLSAPRTQAASTPLQFDPNGNLAAVGGIPSGPPVVRTGPRQVAAAPGEPLALTLSILSAEPTTIQWQIDGVDIPGATQATLLLPAVDASRIGAYRAVVRNASGTTAGGTLNVFLDADRDGLGDSWETTYFANLTAQSGWFDADTDGVSNLDEFREGTHPNDNRSYHPRLTVRSARGRVQIDPWLPYYTNNQPVTLTAFPDPGQTFIAFTSQTIDDKFYSRTNPAVVLLDTSKTVTAVMGLPVEDAGETDMPWTMYSRFGSDGWFGQTNITHDGQDALQTFLKLRGSDLTMTNTMPTAGTISFWWRADTIQANRLFFYVNGRARPGELTGATDWISKTAYLPAGVNVVRWSFLDLFSAFEDPVVEAPSDTAWIDGVVVEPYADPLTDRDADGMADLFEYQHFDTLAAMPDADADSDGISNRDEYLDHTDPMSSISLLPRLTVLSRGGAVLRTPDKSKYDYDETVAVEAVPDPGNYFVLWQRDLGGTNLTNSVRMNGNKAIEALFGSPLAEAMDAPSLDFSRGGNLGFYGQDLVSHDHSDAARSAPLANNQTSFMETTLAGPGSLAFWWKTSCESPNSSAQFSANGEKLSQVSGETDWHLQLFDLPAGPVSLRWAYTNAFNSSGRSNAVWVDELSWIPGTSAPRILASPAGQTVFGGSDAAFTVQASGTPPLRYEWFRNGATLGPATASSQLLIASVPDGLDGSEITVQVSNDYGTTNSAPVILRVLPIPPVNDAFANRSLLQGTNAATAYTIGATAEPDEPAHDQSTASHSVWWRWTAPAGGIWRIVVEGEPEYTTLRLAVYSGGTLASLQSLAANSAYAEYRDGQYHTRTFTEFNVTAGTSYAIAVDTSTPLTTLSVRAEPVPGPVNDAFVDRLPLTGGSATVTGSTERATHEAGEPPAFFGVGQASVWYTWTAPASGAVNVAATQTNSYSILDIFRGAQLAGLVSVAQGTVEFDDQAGRFVSGATFDAVNGQTYHLRVDAFPGGEGLFTLTLSQGGWQISPPSVTPPSPGGQPSLQFSLSGPPGTQVTLESSTDLQAWSTVEVRSIPQSGTLTLSQAISPVIRSRWYRIKVE